MENIMGHTLREEAIYKRIKEIGAAGETREIDETKERDGTSIKLLTIDSSIADVTIVATNLSRIQVHLYGQMDKDEEVDLEVDKVDDFEIKVKTKYTGCCYYSKLKLDITVPHKMFKMIDIKSLSADVMLDEEVLADFLKVRTKFGSVEVIAKLAEIDITTMSGDVELCIDATKDIEIRAITTTGDVSMELQNIGVINLSERTKKRKVKNRHKGGLGHTANIDISTLSGDIRIR